MGWLPLLPRTPLLGLCHPHLPSSFHPPAAIRDATPNVSELEPVATGPRACPALTVLAVNSGGLSFTSVTVTIAVAVFERP